MATNRRVVRDGSPDHDWAFEKAAGGHSDFDSANVTQRFVVEGAGPAADGTSKPQYGASPQTDLPIAPNWRGRIPRLIYSDSANS
jgi:hypothetical protein